MTDNTPVTRDDLNATLRRFAKALGFHSSDFRTYGFERHLEEALADTAEQPTPPESEEVCDLGNDACTCLGSPHFEMMQNNCSHWIVAPPATETRARPRFEAHETREAQIERMARAIEAAFGSIEGPIYDMISDDARERWRGAARFIIDYKEPRLTVVNPSPSTDSGIVETLRECVAHRVTPTWQEIETAASRIETLEKELGKVGCDYEEVCLILENEQTARDEEKLRAEKAEAERDQYRTAYHSEMKKTEAIGAEAKRLREAISDYIRAHNANSGDEPSSSVHARAWDHLINVVQDPSHG